MFSTNVDFIKYCLDYLNIPFEEPFDEVEYNQRIFVPLFKESVLECQKLIDFAGMRREVQKPLSANSNFILLEKDIKYVQNVIDLETKTLLKGFEYSQISSQFLTGRPQVYYFDDATGRLYFDKIADRDYSFYVIYYKFDLDSDPHFILSEAPELLKDVYMSKLALYVGDMDKWQAFMKKFYEMARLQQGLERQKEMINTRFDLKWNYDGWW